VLKWRQKSAVIHTGKLLQFIPFDNVYVYFRYNEEKSVMVIINNSLKDQKLDVTRFKEGIKNYNVGTDIITDSNIDITEDFSIPAKTAMILDLK
jgi:hypothetical protein